jgi:hypothetical protein
MGGSNVQFDNQLAADIMSTNMAASFSDCSAQAIAVNKITICQGDNSFSFVRAKQGNSVGLDMSCTLNSSVVSEIANSISADLTATIAATSEGLLTAEDAITLINDISETVTSTNVSKTMQYAFQESVSSNSFNYGCAQANAPANSVLIANINQNNTVDMVAATMEKSSIAQAMSTELKDSVVADLSASSKSGLTSIMDSIAHLLSSVIGFFVLIVLAIVFFIVGAIVLVVVVPMLKGSGGSKK